VNAGRRSFFKGALLGALGFPAFAAADPVLDTPLTLDKLNALFPAYPLGEQSRSDWADTVGYTVRWTGWKQGRDTVDLVAQATAYPQRDSGRYNGPYFYASCPGATGSYKLGTMFDICPFTGQSFITMLDLVQLSPADLERKARRCRDETVARLRVTMAVNGIDTAPPALIVRLDNRGRIRI
jgi:hypothetical protein